ncbi:hypothetical protein TSST111916_17785 [Tsukamurella strandjordii]|uniref:hypothetical protein n=1 Tax=Tsukamurella TaxID=2060 RepID=UPI001C7DDB6D|nr:hypothetical protein [Tsukamurella sp. TY48]GIZ97169.1 hypothetical protein TTY48_17810 [Tsukamurella sp. TY48]
MPTPPPPPQPRSSSEGGFGSALRELFTAAGSPTLADTAEAANAAGAHGVTAQRLSNWRSGRHLPDRFDTIAPVLIWLTLRAREHHNNHPVDGQAGGAVSVRSMRDWYRLFTGEQSPIAAAALDLKARIDAVEFLLAHPEPEGGNYDNPLGGDGAAAGDSFAPARLTAELKTAVLQLTGIDPVTSIPVATDVPYGELPADAADLLSATGLITAATAQPEQVRSMMRWTDPKIATLWGRAAPLIEQYRPALEARTALLADAARWNTRPDPHSLYTWQQLTACGRHLYALPAAIVATTAIPGGSARPAASPAPRTYRFGDGATAEHIPSPALPFWDASHTAAERQLTVHRLIMATVIGLIVIGVIAAGIAGILTS